MRIMPIGCSTMNNRFNNVAYKLSMKPIPIKLNVPYTTKLIKCSNCLELFVASANSKVNCPHCFRSMKLNNPNYYMEIGGLSKAEITSYNCDKRLMNKLAKSKGVR